MATPVHVRRGLAILLALIVGAVTNFAVSCQSVGRAVLSTHGGLPADILTAPAGVWPDAAVQWPPPHAAVLTRRGYTTRVYALRAIHTPTGFIKVPQAPDVSRIWQVTESGYPFLSFRQTIGQENWHVPVPPGHTPRQNTDDGVTIRGIAWPGRPIWPGFIGNTLCYAAAAYGVGLCLVALARFMKRSIPAGGQELGSKR